MCCLHDDLAAPHIRREAPQGLLNDQPHANGCGQMDDRFALVHEFIHDGFIGDGPLHEPEVRVVARRVEITEMPGRQVVDDGDLLAISQERVDKVGTNETCSSGYQYRASCHESDFLWFAN